MGVTAAIISTVASGYLSARSQKQAYQAQAAQAEQNARILDNNASKMQETIEKQDQANKLNEDTLRKRLIAKMGQQRANIGASGISASGSAANALMDSNEAIERELAMESANNRSKLDSIFQDQTNLVNQASQYKTDAANYRAAGKQAFRNGMLQTAFSLAGTLYGSKSQAKQEQLVTDQNATASAGAWSATDYMTDGTVMTAKEWDKANKAFRKQLDSWGGYK